MRQPEATGRPGHLDRRSAGRRRAPGARYVTMAGRGRLFVLCLVLWPGVGSRPAGANEGDASTAERPGVLRYSYKIITSYPHDIRSFTQGLAYEDGFLYEGTGLYGQSVMTKRELKTANLIKSQRLPHKYFGEGIALFGDKAIQLTWKSQTAFVYDKATFRPLAEFKYAGQGWGVTFDGKRLVLSDGTAMLRVLDPNTYAETDRVIARDRGRPVRGLNELEFIDGYVYANVWPTDYIAIISLKTGRVTGWINLTGLCPLPRRQASNNVLNGIAHLPETNHLLVTGKRWPKLYEIELVRESPAAQR